MRVADGVPDHLFVADFLPASLDKFKLTHFLYGKAYVVLLSREVVVENGVAVLDIDILPEVGFGLDGLFQRKTTLNVKLVQTDGAILLYLVTVEDRTEVGVESE